MYQMVRIPNDTSFKIFYSQLPSMLVFVFEDIKKSNDIDRKTPKKVIVSPSILAADW